MPATEQRGAAEAARDWNPFMTCPPDLRPDQPRSLRTPGGVSDRMRTAAFAELQARDAFRWAAERYAEADPDLREAWRGLALAEDRHLGLILRRMAELGHDPRAKPVSLRLWRSLTACPTARDFALFMAAAEQRGMEAGRLFERTLKLTDRISAEMFGLIAAEEAEHIALARKYF